MRVRVGLQFIVVFRATAYIIVGDPRIIIIVTIIVVFVCGGQRIVVGPTNIWRKEKKKKKKSSSTEQRIPVCSAVRMNERRVYGSRTH